MERTNKSGARQPILTGQKNVSTSQLPADVKMSWRSLAIIPAVYGVNGMGLARPQPGPTAVELRRLPRLLAPGERHRYSHLPQTTKSPSGAAYSFLCRSDGAFGVRESIAINISPPLGLNTPQSSLNSTAVAWGQRVGLGAIVLGS